MAGGWHRDGMAKDSDSADLGRLIDEVRVELDAAGLGDAAGRLATFQQTAFTTGSEYLGELGLAVKEVRRQQGIPPDLDKKLKQILAAVRGVWPTL